MSSLHTLAVELLGPFSWAPAHLFFQQVAGLKTDLRPETGKGLWLFMEVTVISLPGIQLWFLLLNKLVSCPSILPCVPVTFSITLSRPLAATLTLLLILVVVAPDFWWLSTSLYHFGVLSHHCYQQARFSVSLSFHQPSIPGLQRGATPELFSDAWPSGTILMTLENSVLFGLSCGTYSSAGILGIHDRSIVACPSSWAL